MHPDRNQDRKSARTGTAAARNVPFSLSLLSRFFFLARSTSTFNRTKRLTYFSPAPRLARSSRSLATRSLCTTLAPSPTGPSSTRRWTGEEGRKRERGEKARCLFFFFPPLCLLVLTRFRKKTEPKKHCKQRRPL